ncbi:Phosphotransferase [Mycena indigotica]|uniref:Phosphotransferase n=1 Tax=Mycena indigotica TaxID=2126181 RepID=A0A8H6SMJ8_9AGAR|nr:Phosphotransferase [Mycena indigotica]KAF7301605.1 Phosphotransferase [Mycena indigotica]
MPSISAHNTPDAQRIFDEIHHAFELSSESLIQLTGQFLHEFKVGLSGYNHAMAMIPSFVTGVPDGTETGTFLALDLGGTNMRVCEVVLKGDTTFSLRQQKYKVSDALKTGEAAVLFDYLADSVDAFLTSNPPSDAPGSHELESTPDVVHLGLTFSFPVEQTALNSGKILTWTKGFSAKHAIGNDVVKLLQDAFDRKHMHVKCVALVNDTVGALLSRAYTAGGCTLGAIFGTGTNGAYVEDIANIKKLANDPAAANGGVMIVNTEWGAFNNSRSHLPSTPFDNALDRLSINPSFQAFEKMISGMYLGEVTRNILLSLVDAAPKSLLFGGKTTAALNAQWGLDTSVMSAVEEAWEGGDGEATPWQNTAPQLSLFEDVEKLDANVATRLNRVRDVIAKELGFSVDAVSLRDAEIVRWASSMVARRAALLSGVAVGTVLIQTGRGVLSGQEGQPTKNEPKIGVGVDGSLIQFYPHFEETLRESLRIVVGADVEKRVEIGLAKDGSGVGAALCALQAVKQA